MTLRVTWIWQRVPDRIIGGRDDPYMLRWWIYRNKAGFSAYLHRFLRSDDDRALHDHPFASCSILLRGCYLEHLADGQVKLRKPWRPWAPWRLVLRRADAAHRIELVAGEQVWTLFLCGPVVREWGFLCPQGWRHWRDFSQKADGVSIGKGCAD